MLEPRGVHDFDEELQMHRRSSTGDCGIVKFIRRLINFLSEEKIKTETFTFKNRPLTKRGQTATLQKSATLSDAFVVRTHEEVRSNIVERWYF